MLAGRAQLRRFAIQIPNSSIHFAPLTKIQLVSPLQQLQHSHLAEHLARQQSTENDMKGRTKRRQTGFSLSLLLLATLFVTPTILQDVNGWILKPTISSSNHAPSYSSYIQPHRCSNLQRCGKKGTYRIALKSISTDDEESDLPTTTETNNSIDDTNININEETIDQLPKEIANTGEIPQRKLPQQRQQQEEEPSLLETINNFLDKPYFDPEQYDETDQSFLGKMATFAKADYEFFEALFVACFFLLVLTITKDVLRAQMDAAGITAATRGKMF